MNNPEKPTLFIELHGDEEDVSKQAEMFTEIAQDFGGQNPQFSSVIEERNKLWKARHDAYWAMKNLMPKSHMLTTDACVPLSRFSECVVSAQNDLEELGLLGAIIGHAGDGNFHTQILIDPENNDEIARAKEYTSRISMRAIEMDGTCTGEHGIGQGKQKYLHEELGASVDVMRQIKTALDPQNIMNPGKIFSLN